MEEEKKENEKKTNETEKTDNNKLKNKEKKVGEISNLVSNVLYNSYGENVFKSFGVQSWCGKMVSRTGLINQRREQHLASLRPMAKISPPAHSTLK